MTTPPAATPKIREAQDEVLRLARSGFTGTLVFDFKDGVPLAVKVTESRRLGDSRPTLP